MPKILNLPTETKESATEVEKLMYKYYGLYPVTKTDTYYRYVPIHMNNNNNNNNELPTGQIDYTHVEWKNDINIYLMSETIEIKNTHCDIDLLVLLTKRLEELNVKRVVTTGW